MEDTQDKRPRIGLDEGLITNKKTCFFDLIEGRDAAGLQPKLREIQWQERERENKRIQLL